MIMSEVDERQCLFIYFLPYVSVAVVTCCLAVSLEDRSDGSRGCLVVVVHDANPFLLFGHDKDDGQEVSRVAVAKRRVDVTCPTYKNGTLGRSKVFCRERILELS